MYWKDYGFSFDHQSTSEQDSILVDNERFPDLHEKISGVVGALEVSNNAGKIYFGQKITKYFVVSKISSIFSTHHQLL